MSEEQNKVVITSEDIKNIEDFFSHFRMDMPDYLREQLDVFKNNPEAYTIDNQLALKSELAHALVESDHELLKDDLFKDVIDNCSKEWFDTQFQRDFENTPDPEAEEG